VAGKMRARRLVCQVLVGIFQLLSSDYVENGRRLVKEQITEPLKRGSNMN